MGSPKCGNSSFEKTLKVRTVGLLQERLAPMGALRLAARADPTLAGSKPCALTSELSREALGSSVDSMRAACPEKECLH